MKHILLIEKYCRKQFWNCHLRLTCKIKQREKEIITHSSRQTSAWFISVLMNATACDCTLRRWKSRLGVDVSLTQNEHWEYLLRAYNSPPPAAPLLIWRETSGSAGAWDELPGSAASPGPRYKPRSTRRLWCLPSTYWFVHTSAVGRAGRWALLAPPVAPSLKRCWRI